jgi:uncharacterized membrane protein YraQ (UPF0718 family)
VLPPGYETALRESWAFFVHLGIVLVPLFLAGSFLVGLADEYLPPERVERTLRGHDEGTGNVAAAAFGAVTPFCSCSTVPVLAGLLQAGAPLGLSFSFLLASPLVNEIAVLFLLGTFGLKVTAMYVVATFSAAVVGGIVIGRLGIGDHVKDLELSATDSGPVATDGGTTSGSGGTSQPVTGASTCGCGSVAETENRPHRERFASAGREAWSFLRGALPYLLLGMTIGALVHSVVPVSVMHAVLGPENPLAVPLAAVAGAPMYVSMSGMLPIAASLNGQGIAIGTVLAFVVGGAGVSIPNLVLLNKLFDRRLLVVYAATVVAIGVTVGLLFNATLA